MTAKASSQAPELLAPAGSPEALRAAVESGADAVYLGWGGFNARRGAQNFDRDAFAWAVAYCHVRGVRVFLTLNILLTDRELPDALDAARTASRLGVDSVLVQDWGLFGLLRCALPDLPLHASTQMSIFTSGGAREIAADGCERVVVARECSREETAAICRNCPAEIEVFVHGALCMCYSGQCAMSALIGGRSGNRGRCAQPCRLPYGVNEPAGSQRPLSLKDSCLADRLQEMADMGVACLKIEGRMRRPAYVAAVTGVYRRLLQERRGPAAEERDILERAFSRSGFTDAYWRGRSGPEMLGFRPENEDHAPAAEAPPNEERRVPVRLFCRVRAKAPCALTAEDGDGHRVSVTGSVPEPAGNRPLTREDLTARLAKTGGTPYRCAAVDAQVDPGLFLPAAAVNALRREALDALSAARSAPPVRRELEPPPLPEVDCSAKSPRFTVSVSSAVQLTAALLDFRPARVYVPLEVLSGLSSLPACQTQWCAILPRVWRDGDEPLLRRWLEQAKSLGVTGALLGNLGHFPLVRGLGFRLYGDYGLNVFNSRSLAWLREKGLDAACLSFELRYAQIRDMKKILPAEAIVYGRLPLMLTENCLIKNHGHCRCEEPNFLNDRTGAAFPLLPAFGHRTEVENSRRLWLADRPEYRSLGLAYARLRFTTEPPSECAEVYRAYLENAPAQGAFTRGLYQRGVE